ncbi:unnamed protein product [Parnassius mnemosyne]|uniref:Alcohol dehydrogenase n=1 Tax=Parnassius mnemosyne TaxID=213953 RepID=A0AAV1LBV9_9NEOP
MVYDLNGKVVLITGGAEGIGAGVVRCLLEENVQHVAILDVAVDLGTALQNDLNNKYGKNKVKFFKCDVTNEDELFGAFAATRDAHGYIDVVINNAAIMNDTQRCYKKEIEINFTALVTSTLKALELMRKDKDGKGGAIINMSSVAALEQSPMLPIYYGTKSAVLQFSCCLGLPDYYDRTGVRMITMCFGKTDTALLSEKKIATFDEVIEKNLQKYLGAFQGQKVESAARAVVQACKLGESGSVWFSGKDKPVKDVTDFVKEAYGIMTKGADMM